jgi:HEAT repeat protein
MLVSEHEQKILANVIAALARIGDKGAVPALIEATRHPDPFVRHGAAWALGELRDRRAIPALRALLQDTVKPESWDWSGPSMQTSLYRVCDHARMALQKMQRWWQIWL